MMERFFAHIGAAFGLLIVGIVVAALIVQRSMFPNLAFWIVQDFILLAICFVPACLIAGGYFLLFRGRLIETGQFGNYIQNIRGITELPPLAIDAPHDRAVKEVFQVPTVAQLLKDGTLGPNTLLLGFTKEGKAHYGSWDDIRTFAIAGKGRSGKTMTMFFLILQALLNDCIVWVADPHTKTSSITNMLAPLSHLMRFAKTDREIADMTADFIDIMEMRITGESQDHTPMLLVTDEFTRIITGNKQVYQAVVSCAQQYAGVGGYAMVAGHEWTGKEIVNLRRALHAVFVHRLDEGYAKYLIDSKHSKFTEKLRTGANFFKDTDGDYHELRTPLGTPGDAATIATMLLQIEGPYEQNQIVSENVSDRFNSVSNVSDRAETRNVSEILSLEMPRETFHETKQEQVKRLKATGYNQSQIIQIIWNCKPGATQAYEDAKAEYKQILQDIVNMNIL